MLGEEGVGKERGWSLLPRIPERVLEGDGWREKDRDSVTDRGRVTKSIGCWDRACSKMGDEGGQEAGVGGIQATC